MHGNGTILVLDDEAPIRLMVVAALKKEGYTVLEASDPTEAASMIGDGLFHIDVLFSDIAMPKMTGPEFAKEMLAVRPGLKVIFATGSNALIVGDALAKVPHTFFLQKPYTADELRHAVRESLKTT